MQPISAFIVSAFILAGGKSTRMGCDKAFLELGGRTFIALMFELAQTITPDVKIVGDRRKFSSWGEVVEDVYSDCGPLGGIQAALASSNTDWNLILGVDLPFVPSRFLKHLLREAGRSNAIVTVPSAGGHLHPLCAIYRKEFSLRAERALIEGKNKVDALFHDVPTRIISDDELIAAGFDSSIFRNLNTLEEWKAAEREITRLKASR